MTIKFTGLASLGIVGHTAVFSYIQEKLTLWGWSLVSSSGTQVTLTNPTNLFNITFAQTETSSNKVNYWNTSITKGSVSPAVVGGDIVPNALRYLIAGDDYIIVSAYDGNVNRGPFGNPYHGTLFTIYMGLLDSITPSLTESIYGIAAFGSVSYTLIGSATWQGTGPCIKVDEVNSNYLAFGTNSTTGKTQYVPIYFLDESTSNGRGKAKNCLLGAKTESNSQLQVVKHNLTGEVLGTYFVMPAYGSTSILVRVS